MRSEFFAIPGKSGSEYFEIESITLEPLAKMEKVKLFLCIVACVSNEVDW